MICYSIFSPPFLAHYVCCQSFCAKVQLLCREKMRPKMYFLRASHKSPQMFLAGYFIGASDRWSWQKKKMVLLWQYRAESSGSPLLLLSSFFVSMWQSEVPQRRTTRQRHHPQLGSKLSYLALEHKPAMHMDEGIQYNRPVQNPE